MQNTMKIIIFLESFPFMFKIINFCEIFEDIIIFSFFKMKNHKIWLAACYMPLLQGQIVHWIRIKNDKRCKKIKIIFIKWPLNIIIDMYIIPILKYCWKLIPVVSDLGTARPQLVISFWSIYIIYIYVHNWESLRSKWKDYWRTMAWNCRKVS